MTGINNNNNNNVIYLYSAFYTSDQRRFDSAGRRFEIQLNISASATYIGEFLNKYVFYEERKEENESQDFTERGRLF